METPEKLKGNIKFTKLHFRIDLSPLSPQKNVGAKGLKATFVFGG
jgi:hypothetical protein